MSNEQISRGRYQKVGGSIRVKEKKRHKLSNSLFNLPSINKSENIRYNLFILLCHYRFFLIPLTLQNIYF